MLLILLFCLLISGRFTQVLLKYLLDLHHGSHFEILQVTSPPLQYYVILNQNLVGCVGQKGDSEFLRLLCSDVQDGHHSSHHEIHQNISSQTICLRELIIGGRHLSNFDIRSELLKLFRSDTLSDHHDSYLEILFP